MTPYNNVLGVFSYAAHTLANTLWSEQALRFDSKPKERKRHGDVQKTSLCGRVKNAKILMLKRIANI